MINKMQFISCLMCLLTATNLWGGDLKSFNADWKFQLGDEAKRKEIGFDDGHWRVLDLPHDWSIEGEYAEDNPMGGQCGYLPAGIAWYRKTVKVPNSWKGKHVEISFDGVFMNSTVWANGRELGTRPYGWVSFAYDISEEAQTADEITFAVRVDNDKQPSARWYTGSGIYADTWINVQDDIHIPVSGIFVKTKGNVVTVNTELVNTGGKRRDLVFKSTVVDAEGNVLVSSMYEKTRLAVGEQKLLTQDISITNPKLWSVDTPYLYTLLSQVYKGDELIDEVKTRFGVRDVKWLPETGMWINDENIKLRGVCNHIDAGALGSAVPEKIMRFRLQQLKDMGCNAIRTSHYPRPPVFYDICDEIGMLVMDEFFDGWHKKAEHDYGAYFFADWWKRDLTDCIKRDRNHPSIVIYSVGNETRGEIGKDLVEACHELDDTRPVTSGHSAAEYMDVYGVNGHSEKMGFFDELEKDRVFIGTENTHTWQVRGFYRTKTWYRNGYPSARQKPYYYPDLTDEEVFTYDWIDAGGRQNYKQIFNSSYDNAMVRLTSRQSIELLRDIPNYAGTFRWTGHDYIGEATYVHGGWPFKSFMGGAIDMANFEKDLFYLYQSQWTEKPMVHILPHWTHPTLKEGTEIPLWVYSNCDEVELFFNGKSLGKQIPGTKWDEMACQWMVGFEPGELKAVAYNKGTQAAVSIIRTADVPAKNKLTIDGTPLQSKTNDIVQVRVTTTDAKGEFYPYGENRSYFHVIGSGKVRALDNGSPIDVEKHFEATDRIAFYGLTRAYVESTDADGDITLLVSAILGEKKQVTSQSVSIDVQKMSLRGEIAPVQTDIYYTTDGSTPTLASTPYTGHFDVKLGTTVKALVLADGVPVHVMEERFAQDEGFVWDAASVPANLGGNQAEDARFNIANISTAGKNYNGKGFLDFGINAGGFVEWYQENDGSDGDFLLKLRYKANAKIRDMYSVKLTVNGKDSVLKLPATDDFSSTWGVYELSVHLSSGANNIRFTALDDQGLCIDELMVE